MEQSTEHEEWECSILDCLPSGEMGEWGRYCRAGKKSVVAMFTSYHSGYLNSRSLWCWRGVWQRFAFGKVQHLCGIRRHRGESDLIQGEQSAETSWQDRALWHTTEGLLRGWRRTGLWRSRKKPELIRLYFNFFVKHESWVAIMGWGRGNGEHFYLTSNRK